MSGISIDFHHRFSSGSGKINDEAGLGTNNENEEADPDCKMKYQFCRAASFLCGSGSGENFDAVPVAQTPAPFLLYSKAKIWK
jgi:hypothetical protein